VLTRWDSSRPPEVYRTPAGVFFSGEPVVVPGGRPDGHVIICPVLDARNSRSAITLFDAAAIRTGPFATIPLEAPLPPAFHGVWVGASAHA
jgi:carotenoid cleavage dioxygenase-like enzyme